jgi:hypothetical protein
LPLNLAFFILKAQRMRKRITELLKRCYPTVAGAFILMIFALYNGYPLFSNDSASYIHSGYYLQVAGDRPVFYGLFIRATSLGISMWGTVLAQCLILSYLCMRFIEPAAAGHHSRLVCRYGDAGCVCADVIPVDVPVPGAAAGGMAAGMDTGIGLIIGAGALFSFHDIGVSAVCGAVAIFY